ncbi:MAG: ribosome maturation factor RimM [Oscillospiraceae bacterium]|jgi:16S rRNA processing protein RimM|nr:ribosome maturation factor RimM [Oscillospiraceae bacterium]
MKKEYVEVGKIIGARGLRGELKVEHWCDNPTAFFKIGNYFIDEGNEKLNIVSFREYKTIILINIGKMAHRNYAKSLVGKVIYAKREDIEVEENRYLIQDLIGMQVLNVDTAQNYGVVQDVIKTGANDVYFIKNDEGKEYLIPVIDDVIKGVSLETNHISIKPIQGLFND